MALRAVSRNAGKRREEERSSLSIASQWMRRTPELLTNDSVCRFPLPDHEPSRSQAITRSFDLEFWSTGGVHAATATTTSRNAHRDTTTASQFLTVMPPAVQRYV